MPHGLSAHQGRWLPGDPVEGLNTFVTAIFRISDDMPCSS
jgi:hypothetical protein